MKQFLQQRNSVPEARTGHHWFCLHCPKASLVNLSLWWQQERNCVKARCAAANSTNHWHRQLASGFRDSPVKDHPRALLMWMNQRTPGLLLLILTIYKHICCWRQTQHSLQSSLEMS